MQSPITTQIPSAKQHTTSQGDTAARRLANGQQTSPTGAKLPACSITGRLNAASSCRREPHNKHFVARAWHLCQAHACLLIRPLATCALHNSHIEHTCMSARSLHEPVNITNASPSALLCCTYGYSPASKVHHYYCLARMVPMSRSETPRCYSPAQYRTTLL